MLRLNYVRTELRNELPTPRPALPERLMVGLLLFFYLATKPKRACLGVVCRWASPFAMLIGASPSLVTAKKKRSSLGALRAKQCSHGDEIGSVWYHTLEPQGVTWYTCTNVHAESNM